MLIILVITAVGMLGNELFTVLGILVNIIFVIRKCSIWSVTELVVALLSA